MTMATSKVQPTSSTVYSLDQRAILHPILRLRLRNLVSAPQTQLHCSTTPPDPHWKILHFFLFLFRDVGMLIVSLIYTCLRDNTAKPWAWASLDVKVKSATLGLGLASLVLAAFAIVGLIRVLLANHTFWSNHHTEILWLAAASFRVRSRSSISRPPCSPCLLTV